MRATGIAIALLLVSGPVHAHQLLRTASRAAVHWESEEIVVGLGADTKSATMATPSILQALTEAVQAWNALPEMRRKFRVVVASDGDKAVAPAVRVDFCDGTWRHQAGLLATTSFRADDGSGRVGAAVITVNECDYRFVGPDEVAPQHFDLQAVLTHELGHVLGLGHSEDVTAVMFENTGSVRQRRPQPDDRLGLAAIYGASPAAPAAAPAPPPAPRVAPAGAHPDPLTGQLPIATELEWPAGPGVEPPPPAGVATAPAATVVPPAPSKPAVGPRVPRDVLTVVPIDERAGSAAGQGGMLLYTSAPVLLPEIDFQAQPATKLKRARLRSAPARARSHGRDR